jgi:proteasome lid subunit RPN8/RPN11
MATPIALLPSGEADPDRSVEAAIPVVFLSEAAHAAQGGADAAVASPETDHAATTEVIEAITPERVADGIAPDVVADGTAAASPTVRPPRIAWGDDVPLVLPVRDANGPKVTRPREGRVTWPSAVAQTSAPRAAGAPFHASTAATHVQAHLAASARDAIERDLCVDLTRERGGLLVGTVGRVGEGRLVVVVHAAIPADGADAGASWWQLTPQAWEYASRILETQYPGLMIVGWYHSHPGIGCFFSGTDRETQRHIFPNPWNVAAVGDPVAPRGWRGVFGLREAVPPRAMPFRWYIGPDAIPIEAPKEYDDTPVVPRTFVRRAVNRLAPQWRRPRRSGHRQHR